MKNRNRTLTMNLKILNQEIFLLIRENLELGLTATFFSNVGWVKRSGPTNRSTGI